MIILHSWIDLVCLSAVHKTGLSLKFLEQIWSAGPQKTNLLLWISVSEAEDRDLSLMYLSVDFQVSMEVMFVCLLAYLG